MYLRKVWSIKPYCSTLFAKAFIKYGEKNTNQNSKHCSIQDNDIHFFYLKTLLKTGILPIHQTILESVTYFEETAPLYHEETLRTQRWQPEVAIMTLPVQVLRDKVTANYYLYQTGKSADVGGRDRGKKRKR